MAEFETDCVVAQQTDVARFVITVGGEEAGFAEYVDTEGMREFHHTVVHPSFQGKGLSKPLIAQALDATREAGRKVKPTCSAVAHFIEKNADYADMLA